MRFLITFLTFGKDIFAGMENSLYNFVKGLKEVGHEVVVFTSMAYGESNHIDDISVFRCRNLPIDYSEGHPGVEKDKFIENKILLNKDIILDNLFGVIEAQVPDALIAWDPLWGFIQIIDVEREITIPKILVFHVKNTPRVLYASLKYPYTARYAVSNYLRNEIHAAEYDCSIGILPNSIHYDWIRSITEDITKEKIILCNARLSPEKGVEYAVVAFSKFLLDYPDYKLWLCSGEFPFGNVKITKSKILTIVKELGILEHVVFIPNQRWEDLPIVIAKSMIVVMPSIMETFGIAALETMASGTPLVASNVGNLPNLLKNGGILIPPRSPDEISNALRMLVRNASLCRNLRLKSISEAKKYDRKLVADNFVKELVLQKGLL